VKRINYSLCPPEHLEAIKQSIEASLVPLMILGEDGARTNELKTTIDASVVRASEHLVECTRELAIIATVQARRADEAVTVAQLRTTVEQLRKENAKLKGQVTRMKKQFKILSAQLSEPADG